MQKNLLKNNINKKVKEICRFSISNFFGNLLDHFKNSLKVFLRLFLSL
jgi:hypothetical protein